jgi:hypothetical protein
MRNFTTVNYYFQTVLVVVVMLKFFSLLTLTLFPQNLQNERRWWTSLFCVGFRVWNKCYIFSYVVCDFGPCASGVGWCRKLSKTCFLNRSIWIFAQIMILKYKLTYPSGTATALLINSFHTPEGADTAS